MLSALQSPYPAWACVLVTALGVALVGLAKGGFGGGVGFLTTPMLALFLGPRFAIGVLLPLLIVADVFVVWIYHRDFSRKHVAWLLAGAVFGIAAGAMFIGKVDEQALGRTIGAVAIAFVALHWVEHRMWKAAAPHQTVRIPLAVTAGAAAGFVSMIAHSAGVIVAMYLLSQNLEKRQFVATMVLFFAVVNVAKLFPYVRLGLITWGTLSYSMPFALMVPVGVWIGRELNRRVDQNRFRSVILVLVFLAGLNLVFDSHLIVLLLGK